MEEDFDVKPCEIKLESELILDDDYDNNYSAGPCHEGISQVPDADTLKSHSVDALGSLDLSLLNGASSAVDPTSMNGGVPGMTVQIKVEHTEDEDPLPGAALSDKWSTPSETARLSFFEEDSKVLPEDCIVKFENDLPEVNHFPNETPFSISSESGNDKGTEGTLSRNCDSRNTSSRIGIKTCEIKHTASDIGHDLHDETLPKASSTSFHLDKLSPAGSGKRPFQSKRRPARFIEEDEPTVALHSGPSQKASSQVPNTVILKSRPVVCFEWLDLSLLTGASSTINLFSMNGGVAKLAAQIKVENTEDEDPLADAALSEEWPKPTETAPSSFYKEGSTVSLEDIQIKSENSSSEEEIYLKAMPIVVPSKSDKKRGSKGEFFEKCDTRNTCNGIGTMNCEEKDSASDIVQDSKNQTLPKASCTSFHLDNLSSADLRKQPFPKKHRLARFKDKNEPTAELHSSEKPFSCKHCAAQFNWKSSLNTHLRIHSGEKPFSCKHCPARFNQKKHLVTHLCIHSGERPFSCKHCAARFKRKDSLNSHLRIHSDEKPFSCKHCPARFKHKNSLNTHLRIHSGEKDFSCKHCPTSFNRKCSLTRHLRIHSRQKKPFRCKHCLARFNQKILLTLHLHLHHGEKWFSCEHCSARFHQKRHIISHLRTHSDG